MLGPFGARGTRILRIRQSHPLPDGAMSTTCIARFVSLLLLGVVASCDQGHAAPGMSGEMLQDTVATVREARVSVAGGVAPGAQTYSYRGLYAGMTRALLEAAIGATTPDSTCKAVVSRGHDDLVCAYEATVGPDQDRVSVEATYPRTATGVVAVARTVTVTRVLPLDVDGVRLAQMLADAFERQTSLLDKREAEYGTHMAMVRMGTLRGARENYADVTIQFRNGREILTVKLSRSDTGPTPPASRSTIASH